MYFQWICKYLKILSTHDQGTMSSDSPKRLNENLNSSSFTAAKWLALPFNYSHHKLLMCVGVLRWTEMVAKWVQVSTHYTGLVWTAISWSADEHCWSTASLRETQHITEQHQLGSFGQQRNLCVLVYIRVQCIIFLKDCTKYNYIFSLSEDAFKKLDIVSYFKCYKWYIAITVSIPE